MKIEKDRLTTEGGEPRIAQGYKCRRLYKQKKIEKDSLKMEKDC